MAAVKHPPYMFMFMVLLELLSSFSHLKIRVPLKPLLGGVTGVAQVITSHEQTKKTEFAIFISLMWTLLPKYATYYSWFGLLLGYSGFNFWFSFARSSDAVWHPKDF